jgi:hypothetical protein
LGTASVSLDAAQVVPFNATPEALAAVPPGLIEQRIQTNLKGSDLRCGGPAPSTNWR